MQRIYQYEQAVIEIDHDYDVDLISGAEYKQYMRELHEEFADLFEGWDG